MHTHICDVRFSYIIALAGPGAGEFGRNSALLIDAAPNARVFQWVVINRVRIITPPLRTQIFGYSDALQ